MYVTVDARSSGTPVQLHDSDDLDRFHVVAPFCTTAELSAALGRARAGDCTDAKRNHCWIEVSFIVDAADRCTDELWNRRFEGLLQYAGKRGWLDPGGTRLLAHVDRATPAA